MDAIIQQWDCAATKPSSKPVFPNFPAKVCWISDADTAATQIILEPPVPM